MTRDEENKETMFGNGLDFLLQSIRYLNEFNELSDSEKNKSSYLKYSLVFLSTSIELFFKSRLYNENWVYIFDDMEKANKEDIINGKIRSVIMEKIYSRLSKFCDIDLEYSSKDIKKLREYRNQIEHYKCTVNNNALEVKINIVIKHIIEFINKNLWSLYTENDLDIIDMIPNLPMVDETTFNEHERNLINLIFTELKRSEQNLLSAVGLLISKAHSEGIDVEKWIKCPKCKQKTLAFIDQGKWECKLCEEKISSKELIDFLMNNSIRDINHGDNYPVNECPNCEKETLVENDEGFICFECGNFYSHDELSLCQKCQHYYLKNDETKSDDIGLCETCYSEILEKE